MPGFLTARAVLRGRVHQRNQHLGVLSGNAVVHVRLFAQPDRKQGQKRPQIRAREPYSYSKIVGARSGLYRSRLLNQVLSLLILQHFQDHIL